MTLAESLLQQAPLSKSRTGSQQGSWHPKTTSYSCRVSQLHGRRLEQLKKGIISKDEGRIIKWQMGHLAVISM